MRRIRNALMCLCLAAASLQGIKMRPDEIEALMEAMRKPKVARVLRVESDDGEGEATDLKLPAGCGQLEVGAQGDE
jgi:hypothetical protein